MITFIPRDKVSKNWIIIAPILSIVFTIFFGLLIFTFLGYNPIETLYQIFISPFSRITSPASPLIPQKNLHLPNKTKNTSAVL